MTARHDKATEGRTEAAESEAARLREERDEARAEIEVYYRARVAAEAERDELALRTEQIFATLQDQNRPAPTPSLDADALIKQAARRAEGIRLKSRDWGGRIVPFGSPRDAELLEALARRVAVLEAAEARVSLLEERVRELENGLRELERMAGAAGSGETPAMPIAIKARALLGSGKDGTA